MQILANYLIYYFLILLNTIEIIAKEKQKNKDITKYWKNADIYLDILLSKK